MVGTGVPGRLLTRKIHMKQKKTDRIGSLRKLQPTQYFRKELQTEEGETLPGPRMARASVNTL